MFLEPIKGKPTKKRRNVLNRMDEIKGPLALLRRCRDTQTKVKVIFYIFQ